MLNPMQKEYRSNQLLIIGIRRVINLWNYLKNDYKAMNADKTCITSHDLNKEIHALEILIKTII
jgi:hypothetical protein